MTDKRFHAKIDEFGAYYSVCENQKIVGETVDEYDAVRIVKRLNEQDERIKLLKDNIKDLKMTIDFKNDVIGELENRNERQAQSIDKLYKLLETRDLGKIDAYVNKVEKEIEEANRLMELEMGQYCGDSE